jgi:hypothetical protein
MRYSIEDVGYKTAKDALESHGFAVVETKDETGQPLAAEIWTALNEENVPYGFICGRLNRHGFSLGQSFELVMDDFFLRDDIDDAKIRYIDVVRDILFRKSIR